MAVTTDDLLIKIQADTGNASKSIEILTKQLGRLENSVNGVNNNTADVKQTMSSFGAAMVHVNQTIEVATKAYELLSSVVGGTINEYKKSVDEIVKLRNTLNTLGTKDVANVVKAFDAFGDVMEETTTVSGGHVLGLVNIAKAAGISDDMTKKLIKTSADLAATGRTDLQGAFNALLKSLKGSTGALAVMAPELTNMDKKAAKAGGAIDYLSASLGGMAENELKTFAGQAALMNNRLEKFQENIGAIIGGIFGLKPGVSVINELLKEMNAYLQENRQTFIDYGMVVVDSFKSVFDVIGKVFKFFQALDFSKVMKGLASVGVVLGGVFLAFNPAIAIAGLVNLGSAITIASVAAYKAVAYIVANTAAWVKNAAAQTRAAITTGLVAAGIATVIIALDLLIRNLGNAPKLFKSMFWSILTGLGVVASAIADLFGLDSVRDKIDQLTDYTATAFSENAVDLNSGLLGNALDGIDTLKKAWAEGTAEMKEDVKVDNQTTTGGKKPQPPNIVSPEVIKALEELRAKNAQMAFEIRSADMLQMDIIKEKYDLEIDALKLKYKDLEVNEQVSEELENQIKLLEQKATLEQKKAPSREFESAEKPLNEVAKNISGAITGGLDGVMGSITGMMSGASAIMDAISGVVGFVQKLIDFIPQILNAVANIFNTLADLPLKILEGVQNVFKGAIKLVTDFIPNLLKAVPEIIFTIFKGLYIELPKAFMQLMKMLPDIILNIITELPSMIAEIVEGIISYIPEMAITFVQTIVANAPKIYVALARLFYIEIPKAIIRGIINGIKAIASAFGGLFGGKGAKVDLDPRSITDSMKKAARVLTGEASKLFKVSDLGADGVGQKVKDQLEAVEDAGRNARNWLLEAWQWILARFQEVVDGLLYVWRMVYDSIILPFLGALQAAWNFINDSILKPLISGLRAVFQFAQNVLGYISDGIRSAFAWASNALGNVFQVLRNTIEPLVNAFQSAIASLSNGFGWLNSLSDSVNKLSAGFSWIGDLADSIRKLTDWDWPEVPGIGGGGGGGGGVIGQVADEVSSWFSNGGPVYAANGMVMPKRGTDTVPAMLTPGEFVMQRSAVNSIGLGNLERANATGQLPVGGNQVYNISINVDAKTAPDEKFIRGTMLPLLKEELRRASLDGQRVIFQGGIR